jgi:branched-subunit amino acid aminotransferase/4-amino-4-deoxychorismate lyase
MDFAHNRSFKYGDGLFETLRLINNKVVFLKEHFERLEKGFEILGFDKPEGFSSSWLESEILKYFSVNNIDANLLNWRVRISFWRNSNGFYCPESNAVSWVVEIFPLENSKFVLNSEGLEIGIYEDVKISPDILSAIKTTSALPYVMAAIHRKKMGWDDALILNSNAAIAEASASNIFILKNNQLLTPSAAEGPVLGVCRSLIIERANALGIEVHEGRLSVNELYEAEEIWLTNTVSGIKWIKNIVGNNLNLGFEMAKIMTNELNKKDEIL